MGNDLNTPLIDLAQEAIGWQRDLWAGIQRRTNLHQPSFLAPREQAAYPEALIATRGSADDVLDRLRAAAAL